VQNGNLYLALYPQVVSAAAAHVSGKGKSILENPAFVAMRKRLGDASADSIQFVDLQKITPDSYSSWVAISRLDGFGDVFGVQAPPMLLPSLGRLMPYLSPAGQVTWTDAAGAHLRGISPFPGSEALGADPGSMGVGQEAMLISILLPALNKAREQARRVQSASNLRQIGLGALMYANAQPNGAFPRDLGAMLKENDLSPRVFSNPRRSDDGVPAAILSGSKSQQADWINQNSDYLWFGAGQKNTMTGEQVLGSEKPAGLQEGLNLLFGDGHVEFINMERAMQLIDQAGKARP
jgi:prepilin-type processing-associated H-X9-DG protein